MTARTHLGRFRHKVILASAEKGLERFESLDAMPPVLRARCLRALESGDSATVVIAGGAGSGGTGAPAEAAAAPAQTELPRGPSERSRELWTALGLLLAVLAAAASLFLWRG